MEALKEQLAAKSKELESCARDVVVLQARVNRMMADAAGPSVAPKQTGDAPQELRAVKTIVGQDDVGLPTPA